MCPMFRTMSKGFAHRDIMRRSGRLFTGVIGKPQGERTRLTLQVARHASNMKKSCQFVQKHSFICQKTISCLPTSTPSFARAFNCCLSHFANKVVDTKWRRLHVSKEGHSRSSKRRTFVRPFSLRLVENVTTVRVARFESLQHLGSTVSFGREETPFQAGLGRAIGDTCRKACGTSLSTFFGTSIHARDLRFVLRTRVFDLPATSKGLHFHPIPRDGTRGSFQVRSRERK